MTGHCDSGVGTQHALLSPSCTVHVTGSARGLTVTFHPPHLPAGAEPAVPDSPDAVAAVPAVLDSDGGAAYSDRVEHGRIVPRGAGRVHFEAECEECGQTSHVYLFEGDSFVWSCCYCNESNDGREDFMEAMRQARLRRWQAIG